MKKETCTVPMWLLNRRGSGRVGGLLRSGYLLLILLFLYLPIGTLMVLSFNEGKTMSTWTGFSLRWYAEMLGNQVIMDALVNTLTIALWASVIATIVGVMACVGLTALRNRSRNLMLGLNHIPLLNADIVTGISIMMAFMACGISLSYGTVLFAHITFCIPYVILSVMPKFKQLSNHTYEAALDLGASPIYAFFNVVLPDIKPGIVSGFLLSFTMSVDDFVITHFTRGAGINTLSTLIYSQVRVGIRPTLYALSTVVFVLVLVVLVVVNVVSGRQEKAGSVAAPTVAAKVDKNGGTLDFDPNWDTGRRRRMKRAAAIVLFCVILGGSVFAALDGKAEERKTLYVYCFGDYFDPALEEQFEAETGYDVTIDYFDTNEELYPMIKNNPEMYDVICASDYMIAKMEEEGMLREINFGNVPNARYITDSIKPFIEEFDPGMMYSVPHTWGTYGIMYNTKMVEEADLTGWDVLWNEKYADKVIMPDSIREAYMIAARRLGYSINTADEAEVAEMTALLKAQKPMVYRYANDSARELMLGESAAMAVITSGEVLYSQELNENLTFFVPPEGTEVWTDCWAITAGARNKAGAEAWINFMLNGEVAAVNFDYLTYAIPNTQIAALTDSPVLNPAAEVLESCETLHNLGAEADAMYSRYWKELKAE